MRENGNQILMTWCSARTQGRVRNPSWGLAGRGQGEGHTWEVSQGNKHLCLHLKVSGGSLSAEDGREYFRQKVQKWGCLQAQNVLQDL